MDRRSRQPSAYLDGLKLLARRELSVAQLRARLLDRDHGSEEVERAIEQLLETGELNDARVARAYAASAISVKGRGRLRVQHELQAIGIARDVAAQALGEAFGEVDERTLIEKALKKKLRGQQKLTGDAEYARVYQFLARQGFSPSAISAVLRSHRKGSDPLK